MRVKDLMNREPVTCDVNDPLTVAARMMWDHDCGAVIVTRDDGKLAGMITDRDICMGAYTQGKALDEILVHSVMANHVIVVHPDQKHEEAEQLMADHQLRRLPVVDNDRKPVGMITLTDLASESVQPDSRLHNGFAKVAHTLAAICRPHGPREHAA